MSNRAVHTLWHMKVKVFVGKIFSDDYVKAACACNNGPRKRGRPRLPENCNAFYIPAKDPAKDGICSYQTVFPFTHAHKPIPL